MNYDDPQNRFVQEVILNQAYNFLSYYPTVIDIGANIGTFSFWIYDHTDKIYAIEPVEENIKSLQRTIAKNGLKKIVVKQLAISDKSLVKNMIKLGEPSFGGWRLDEAGDYPVDCRTLEDFMDSEKIEFADLVKIDVEGEELKILRSPFFPKDKIGTIIGELHDNVDRTELKETCEWLGFRYYEILNNYFLARK